jgi:hypothetical protein
MCKEMPVLPFNRVLDPKCNRKNWRAEEEERHKGSLTPQKMQIELIIHNSIALISLKNLTPWRDSNPGLVVLAWRHCERRN